MLSRQYDKKIQIYRIETVADGYGGSTVSDVLIGSYWAEVSQNSAFRDTQQGMSTIKNNWSFKIRANDFITPYVNNLSILYRGNKYVINDIRYNDELFRELNITANGI
jgi:SPP1 family predicted phage head-tail adaptor